MNVRRPSADDVAPVARLIADFDVAYTGETDVDEAEVRDWWRELDPARDVWLVELDGRLAGCAMLETRGDRLVVDAYVHPEEIGRGVGARLVELTEEAARERGADHLQNGVLHGDERAAALLASRGYRPVRHYYRMLLELGDEPPRQAPVPEGISLAPFDPEHEAEAVHRANQEAFAEEWDFRPRDLERWRADTIAKERFDPTLWRVARDGDEVAGYVSGERHHGACGFVPTLAVRRPWRRRGLGLALLTASFRAFHERGDRAVALFVDSENPTGATRLYERAGMRIHWRADLYEKELA